MNLVSPFGRLSRRGYLAVGVPMVVVIAAVGVAAWQFQPPAASMEDFDGGPWLRWMLIALMLIGVAVWCLFCAAVKRLHDFGWTGLFILPLLSSWLCVAGVLLLSQITAWLHITPPDPTALAEDIGLIGIALGLYSLAALIVLAIVPTARRYRAATDAVTV